MRYLTYIYILIFIGTSTAVCAQKKKKKPRDFGEGEVPFRNELYIGGGIHTRGWNVNLNYAFIRKPMRTMSFTAEFGEIMHPKERTQTFEGLSIIGSTTKAFIYGKRNSLFVGRLGYSEKLYLSSKESRRAISLAWTYGGGISLGMVKPYYLNLIYRNSGGQPTIRAEKYGEDNWNKFLSPQEIDGPTGASRGWDELLLEPGFYVKTALLVDWGAFDEVVKGFEVGLSMDTYFSRIPIMIFEENTPIFVNLYLHIYLGKRW